MPGRRQPRRRVHPGIAVGRDRIGAPGRQGTDQQRHLPRAVGQVDAGPLAVLDLGDSQTVTAGEVHVGGPLSHQALSYLLSESGSCPPAPAQAREAYASAGGIARTGRDRSVAGVSVASSGRSGALLQTRLPESVGFSTTAARSHREP